MKDYESVSKTRLTRRIPMLLRVDGKAFSSLTSICDKPFDLRFQKCMWAAAEALCKQIQGSRLAYVQSDEISVLVIDYQDINTQAWFDYEVQKMTSIGASIASVAFYARFIKEFPDSPRQPVFDGRVWSLPQHEVTNYFIWRQQDNVRNSINALGQANFSHRQLQGKNTSQVQEMLFSEKNINWNDCPIIQKRGACIVKYHYSHEAIDPRTGNAVTTSRSEWRVDEEIPTFTQDRNYIERFVNIDKEDKQ